MSKELSEILSSWYDESDISTLLESMDWIPLSSSNLAAVAYNKNRYELFIAFLDGSIYVYDGVPYEEYTGLVQAVDSHGEFFYDNIRLVYPYERLAG